MEVVGAVVLGVAVGEGRLQAGARARWLQLLMEGSYLSIKAFLSREDWTKHFNDQRSPGACRTEVSVALSRTSAS